MAQHDNSTCSWELCRPHGAFFQPCRMSTLFARHSLIRVQLRSRYLRRVCFSSSPPCRGLYLSNNSLSGSIPDALMQLSELRTVHMPMNALTGSLPGDLTKLTRLEYAA